MDNSTLYKNFQALKVRCTHLQCQKTIDILKLHPYSNGWYDEYVLDIREEDETLIVENSYVAFCGNCENETHYFFKMKISSKEKPNLIRVSSNLEHLVYAADKYQLEFKNNDFKNNNFLDEVASSSLIIFYDKKDLFSLEEPTILKGHIQKESMLFLKDNYEYNIAPNTIIFEDGKIILNHDVAVQMENIYLYCNLDGSNEDDSCVFPNNNAGISFENNVLIIPSKYIKEIKESLEIRSGG